MRGRAVVALEEVFRTDLPVRGVLGLGSLEEAQRVDVDAGLRDAVGDAVQVLAERRGLRIRVDEEERAPGLESQLHEAELLLLDAALANDPVAFACNQLTVIVPVANPAGIDVLDDLAAPGIRVVAAAEDVPITRYAMQLVDALGIADGYTANVVSEEDNVAAVRAKIELGEGDAAIVYVTDAIASGDAVLEIPVSPASNVPATYAAVAVALEVIVAPLLIRTPWLLPPAFPPSPATLTLPAPPASIRPARSRNTP